MHLTRAAFAIFLPVLAACSSSTTTTTFDDGGTNAAGDGGGAASSICNTIVNAAPAIPFSISSDAVPAATGGTIEDGTYFETSATYYTMDDAGVTASELGTVQTTIVITGGVAQTVTKSSLGSDATTATASSKLTMNGTTLVTSDSCPDTRATTSAYSATATTVTLYIAETSTLTSVDVFTKQ